MKAKTYILVIFLFMGLTITIKAQQGVAINVTGTASDSSAMLDVSSITKGLLIPRMNSVQRTSILNPANGLIVFDTGCQCFYYFISTGPSSGAWRQLVADATNSTLYDIDGDSYLTFAYDGAHDDTLYVLIEETERYRITAKAIEPMNNDESVFIGEGAGFNDNGIGMKHNLFIGYHAGYYTVSNGSNTAVGYYSLSANTASFNTAFGSSSLRNNTSGTFNTAVGVSSQMMNTTGSSNTSLGYQSLMFSKGSGNVAIGQQALSNDTLGNYNVAVGYRSMNYNKNSQYNTALGNQALYSHKNGNNNVAVGHYSMFSDTTGQNNSAFGSSSLYLNSNGSNNTAIGYNAAYTNKTGNSNLAIGREALYSNEGGNYNTAIGSSALYNNVNNSRSTAIGYNAMINTTNSTAFNNTFNTAVGYEALRGGPTISSNTGRFNTALGDQSLRSITSGDSSTAAGYLALYSNTTGSQNTAFGSEALYLNSTGNFNTAIGIRALKQISVAGSNTAVGYQALLNNISGSSNTAMGYGADTDGSDYSNTTTIGNQAVATSSNQVRLGNSSVSSLYCYGAYNGIVGTTNRPLYADDNGKIGYVSSSKRYKKNITEMENVEWIYDLRPVNFTYIKDEDQRKQYGLIAEEVEKIKPEFVSFNGGGQPETVSYSSLITPLLKAVQDQQAEIEKLRQEIEELKAERR